MMEIRRSEHKRTTLELFCVETYNQHKNLEKALNFTDIPIELVEKLIATQFPEYANLKVKPVEPQGWDNRTFRLGNEMSIRLPSSEIYAEKVAIEHKWLPKLAKSLSIPIPNPIKLGRPSDIYPWNWSIYGWIEGESANISNIQDLDKLAIPLAHFLHELQAINTSDGPLPGSHNFLRGASPIVYDSEARSAIDNLQELIDREKATSVWQTAIDSKWDKKPVWIHGDFSAGNILLKNNELAGVIDFGGMAVGDPSCDLTIAWTLLKENSRDKFKKALSLDEKTWQRAKGWALWKALITLEGTQDKTSRKAKQQLQIIQEIYEPI
jgi:aminoglycoside phosphotransferase (APT) family kinase protein